MAFRPLGRPASRSWAQSDREDGENQGGHPAVSPTREGLPQPGWSWAGRGEKEEEALRNQPSRKLSTRREAPVEPQASPSGALPLPGGSISQGKQTQEVPKEGDGTGIPPTPAWVPGEKGRPADSILFGTGRNERRLGPPGSLPALPLCRCSLPASLWVCLSLTGSASPGGRLTSQPCIPRLLDLLAPDRTHEEAPGGREEGAGDRKSASLTTPASSMTRPPPAGLPWSPGSPSTVPSLPFRTGLVTASTPAGFFLPSKRSVCVHCPPWRPWWLLSQDLSATPSLVFLLPQRRGRG